MDGDDQGHDLDQFNQVQYRQGEIQHQIDDESGSESDIADLEEATDRER